VLMAGGSPLYVGTRHPVLLLEAAGGAPKAASSGEVAVMLTSGAVLHGTPAAPCVAAWEAASPAHATPTGLYAILSGDLVHSFVFRAVGSGADAPAAGGAGRAGRAPEPTRPSAEPSSIEYRAVTCRFDPAAKVPDVVFSEPATIRTER